MNPDKFPPRNYSDYIRGRSLAEAAGAGLFARLEDPVQSKDFAAATDLIDTFSTTSHLDREQQGNSKLMLGYHEAKFQLEVHARDLLAPFAPKEEEDVKKPEEPKNGENKDKKSSF